MSEEKIPLLRELVDQLPFSVALHGLGKGFPVLYRNRRDDERLKSLHPERAVARDPRLRELAERVVATRERGNVEINVPGRDGETFSWDWIMVPLFDGRGELVGLASVVEDVTRPALARRRMEKTVVQGMELTLLIARLAEKHASVEAFLTAVAERLRGLIGAERVAFNEYDPRRRVLVPKVGARASVARSASFPAVPCDPDASHLLAQVAFTGRVYAGTVDLTSFDFRPYVDLVDLSQEVGTKVLFVPWRAGDERLGVLAAQRGREREGFAHEDAMVLMAAGHTAGLVCQRKRAELRLAERARQLESLEQAKSSFLRLASHELRGPLTLLNGYVSLLSDPGFTTQRRQEMVPVLEQAVNRMSMIVAQLTDGTRLEDSRLQLHKSEVDLRDVVRSAVDNVLPLWRRDRQADFELALGERPAPVTVDVLRVETIVQNLLDNAFKYSTVGDRVRCEMTVDEACARVVVQDAGIGISEEEMADLFTRFGRIVNARNSHIGGTGLGLFISQEFARMHGGEIDVESAEGQGSRFELRLPIATERDGRNGEGPLP
jgi:signal transduction histidine kinase